MVVPLSKKDFNKIYDAEREKITIYANMMRNMGNNAMENR